MSDEASRPLRQPPRGLRVLIFLLGVLLTFLFIWLLGFLQRDIRQIPGPDFAAIEKPLVDVKLLDQQTSLTRQLAALDISIQRQAEIQLSGESIRNLARQTMQQMMDLHRLSLEKGIAPTAEQQSALAEAQGRFLTAQQRIDASANEKAQLEQRRFDLRGQADGLVRQIAEQRVPVREEFNRRMTRHRLLLAGLELAVMVPLFLLAAWIFQKKRGSIYRPIALALLLATSLKIGMVIHEYFPSQWFKYIAIGAAILITLAFMVHLLRLAARPRLADLFKRYREAYNQRRCAVCNFPIHRGPWRQAVWTGKGPQLATPPAESPAEEPYTCPSCGTVLYELCDSCHHTRHSLLPYCESCGVQKPVPTGDAPAAAGS